MLSVQNLPMIKINWQGFSKNGFGNPKRLKSGERKTDLRRRSQAEILYIVSISKIGLVVKFPHTPKIAIGSPKEEKITRIDTAAWRSWTVSPIPDPCSFGCPCRSEWIPIPQQALSSALVGCRSDCGSLLWCSFTSFFVYYINYMVLHCITYTFFHLSLAFSLFRSIFFITNPCIT